MSKDKFHKRSGTTDQGKDYENILVAYYSLILVLDREVADFKISSNDDKYGNFDDLVVQIIWKNGSTEQFNIQAKHKQTNKNKNLLIDALKAENGKFSIKKRFEELSKDPSHQSKLILFTNRKLEVKDNAEVISDLNFVVYITHHETQFKIDASNDKQNSVFRFYVRVNSAIKVDKKKLKLIEQYKKFCRDFFLYTNQKNVNDIRDVISALLQDNLKCGQGPVKNYIDFVANWSSTDGKKDKLTKSFVQLKIAECLLSPYILIPSDMKDTDKSNLFKLAADAFEVTTICNADLSCSFYRVNFGCHVDLEVLNRTGLKYQIIPKYFKNLREINRLQRTILYWLLNEWPLILKVTHMNEELISEVINLFHQNEERRRFILIGSRRKFRNWKTFSSLSDLYLHFKEIYDTIVTSFSCSFHGQKETKLEEIIDNNEAIRSAFTTDELILMLEGCFNFGGNKEALPDYYIERRLTKITIDYSFIERFGDSNTVVISCNDKINSLKSRFPEINFLMIDETQDNVNSPNDNSTEFFNKSNVFLASESCSREDFKKNCAKNPTSACHHLQIDQNNNLEWLESCSSIHSLKHFRAGVHYIKEKNILDSHKLNIICADAGMGKSMMMSNLKNNYSSNFWVVNMLLREHVTFFEKNDDHDKFVQTAFGKNLTQFETRIFNIFKDQRRLVFIWDGIDEIGGKVFNNVLKVIDNIRKQGFIQWITARSNLRKKLEEQLNVFARQIKPFGKKDQETYIMKRLHFVKDLDRLTKLILAKIDNEHLGVPLQIFMLTELYQHNHKACTSLLTHTFSVTELFQHFVDEKFNFYYQKANINLSNNVSKQILQEHKAQRLELYQTVALNLCLPPTVSSTLNLHNPENFLVKIQKENDAFGILEVVNNVPNFAHRTYAEYFVALWLSQNYRRIANLEFIFDGHFKNIRFMFDLIMAKESPIHVSVLHKSVEGVNKHLDKINCQDHAGRTPLHLASSWGETHTVLTTQYNGKKITINPEKSSSLRGEGSNYKQILEVLVTRSNIKQKDLLFHYDCLEYADQSLSLASIDTISKFHRTDFNDLTNFKNLASVLYYAVKMDYINLFKNITEIPYVETNLGGSLLHLCASFNRPHFLPKIMKNKMYKTNVNKRDQRKWAPIHYASRYGHLDMIKKLKQVGSNIDLGVKTGEDTPLLVAVQYGQMEVLKYLLENKVDVNASKKNGWTPLIAACQKMNLVVIKLLLEYGALVNKTNSEGYGPLYVSARKGDLQAVNYLISKNAKVNLVGKNGEGPLYIAAKLGHLKVVKLLIHKNANVNAAKTSGWTPLMVAISHGHISVVKLLLENKASCNTRVTFGSRLKTIVGKLKLNTPLNISAKNGSLEIAKLLFQYGAAVNGDRDLKPLLSAVSCGHSPMVEFLMAHGAAVTPEAVKLAAEKKYSEIVNLLMEKINDSDKQRLFAFSSSGFQQQSSTKMVNCKNNGIDIIISRKKKWIVIIALIVVVIVVVLVVSNILNHLIVGKAQT